MKKLLYAMSIATSMFCSTAYSQQQVLSCLVKTASGTARTSPVEAVKVGTRLNIPVNSLRENGSTYEGSDLFGTDIEGEKTIISINRETGEFKFSAMSGFSDDPKWGTYKSAAGLCKTKKMKL